jgi:hypothetical protein
MGQRSPMSNAKTSGFSYASVQTPHVCARALGLTKEAPDVIVRAGPLASGFTDGFARAGRLPARAPRLAKLRCLVASGCSYLSGNPWRLKTLSRRPVAGTGRVASGGPDTSAERGAMDATGGCLNRLPLRIASAFPNVFPPLIPVGADACSSPTAFEQSPIPHGCACSSHSRVPARSRDLATRTGALSASPPKVSSSTFAARSRPLAGKWTCSLPSVSSNRAGLVATSSTRVTRSASKQLKQIINQTFRVIPTTNDPHDRARCLASADVSTGWTSKSTMSSQLAIHASSSSRFGESITW